MKKAQLVISAATSGGGKTTISLGLMRALSRNGLRVQPFKCGGDFIDPQLHYLASGRPSYNLDLYLSSEKHVREIYGKYTEDSDAVIVEGMMGLYDGYDRWKGSTAAIAKSLHLPVLLILEPEAMGYSVAALVKGFASIPPFPRIAGVIFNHIQSEGHYRLLCEACQDIGIQPLGYLPTHAELSIPSRSLGLSSDHSTATEKAINQAANLIEKHLNIDEIINLTSTPIIKERWNIPSEKPFTTAIARDEAFSFIHQANLDYLQNQGTLHYFSPLNDQTLPSADLLYFPGGYPELYLKRLSQNKVMLQAIKNYLVKGGKALAEGGGMMYLSTAITDTQGERYPMVGALPQEFTMNPPAPVLGFRHFTYNNMLWRGHEFHTSQMLGEAISVANQFALDNSPTSTPLLRYHNIIATYTHLYFAEDGQLLSLFD